MNQLHAIEDEIIKLTTFIKTNYPELYVFLTEDPITLPSVKHPDMNTQMMENYLESLKQLLKHHIETHKNK